MPMLCLHQRGSVAEELERLKMSSRCMNEDRILDLLYGICSGLQHLHNHQPINIAHRCDFVGLQLLLG